MLLCVLSASQTVNASEAFVRFALHKAVREGDLGQVKGLIAEGADVNEKDFRQWTPLHWAADMNSLPIAEVLLAKGAGVSIRDTYGLSAINVAEIRGHQRLANVLIASTGSGIFAASVSNDVNSVRASLKRDPNQAVIRDAGGFTPLHLAARSGRRQVIELLLDSGAEIDARTKFEMTPLQFAAVHGHKDVVDLLVARGAKIDIFVASALGDTKQLADFLAHDPNLVNAVRANFTPLHWAAYCGHADVAEMLIVKGANVNAVVGATGGAAPLYWAVKYNHVHLARLLFAKGANLDGNEKLRSERLGYSIHLGHKDMAELLISKGADPRGTFADTTMLHTAVLSRRADIVGWLLAKGVDSNTTDKNGRTALDLADSIECKPVADLLRGHEARKTGPRPPN